MQPFDSGRIKRFFRATRKLNVAGLVSHVTQRAAGSEPLFIEDDDYMYMIWLLKEVLGQHDVEVYAFCLMPNHMHLIFRPKEENLYDAMRDLFSRYAMRFNRRYERKGHLFGGPYRQAVCLDDTYLLSASLYVHLNPAKAGICGHPLEYRWSSVKLYCTDSPDAFVKPEFILGLLGEGEDMPVNRQKYLELLERGADVSVDQVLEQEDAINRFRKKLASYFPSLFERMGKRNATIERISPGLMDMSSLELEVKRFRDERMNHTPESKEAKKYVIQQLVARGYKRYEVAAKLDVSTKTVYNILKS